MKKFLLKYIKTEYVKNILTLISGTAIAQAIPFMLMPVLSRLYTAEDFGVLGFVISVSTIIAVIATGRYELAIMMPKEDRKGIHLTVLSVSLLFLFSLLSFVFLVGFKDILVQYIENKKIIPYLYYIPVLALFLGLFQCLFYWFNRSKKYKKIAGSRVVQSTSISIIQISSGYLKATPAGLVGGRIFGFFLSVMILLKSFVKDNYNYIKQIRLKDLLTVAKEYKKFPQFLILSHGIGQINMQLPIFIISYLFGLELLGQFNWANRIIAIPAVLIATNIGDVFREKATKEYNTNGEFRETFIETLKKTILIAIIPFSVFIFFSPFLFSFAFGEEWRIAGEIASIVSIASFVSFIVTPLDKAALIVGNTKYILSWHTLRFILNITSYYLVKKAELNIDFYLYILTAINLIMYFIELIICYNFSKGRKKIFRQ